LLCWSGGKDCAMTLHELRQRGEYEVAALLTTLTQDYDRISMHGIRNIILEQQAKAVGLPLEKMFISKNASNEEYEQRMQETLEKYLGEGVTAAVFGDIFLEDIRAYREEKLARVGMKALFPIWKRDTGELACKFIDLGFKAIVTCANSKLLESSFAGSSFNEQFLSTLPEAVDPCGENGEFHTLRDNGFYYCDLTPAITASAS